MSPPPSSPRTPLPAVGAALAAGGAATRPPEAEPPSSGFGTTAFGNTAFGVAGASTGAVAMARPAPVFDVCHVGVVLRSLFFVHAVLAVGALFGAPGWQDWLVTVGVASSAALPAVLLWLVLACGLRHPLGRLPPAGQAAAALAMGAACGAAGALPLLLWPVNAGGAATWLASALAGAGFAGAVYCWLQWRARAQLPAVTTARLAELQARIRPHFLFNTLNTALALVRFDPARAEGVLEDLAELFRVAISEPAEAATLAEEVALAQRYLAIEQIRFGARLQVQWELDPAADAARLPALLLQPLVENAVRHGVEPAGEGGVIRIRTRARNGRVMIVIGNSVPAGASTPGHGIALANVRERLDLMHDVAASFDARRDEGGYRVQIVLPL